MPEFQRCSYSDLNGRQQEAYNFQKVSGVLADYGYVTIRLSSDWGGADFIAQHLDGKTFLKVQLKGRLTFCNKYEGKGLDICFHDAQKGWYIYPHDEVLKQIRDAGRLSGTVSWDENGEYHYPRLPKGLESLLEPHRLKEVHTSQPDANH